ncbi:hypothetical protein L1887_44942 [Cichorium endivia]|nr:hypothetical protein L1887_44942 [Cichorium endivia]
MKFLLLALALPLAACTAKTTPPDAPKPPHAIGMANPASVYCLEKGGEQIPVQSPQGPVSGVSFCERSMFQLKPGSMAMIVGARTASGRRNIGKSVELFGLCEPGLRFVNPVNGVMTQLPATADRALWLVTGDVYAFDNQHGFAFVRAEHLMPLTPDEAPQILDELKEQGDGLPVRQRRQTPSLVSMLRQFFPIGLTEGDEINGFAMKGLA